MCLTASEHEGFSVFTCLSHDCDGVPLMACASTSVPGIFTGAVILFDSKID
jgi:hypothetical protein